MTQFTDMKKLLFTTAAALFLAPAFSQSIYKITLNNTGNVESIAFEVEPSIILNISPEGNITNWGFDVYKDRGGENYNNQYQPYVGRIEYYTQNDDAAIRGKIKSIGRTQITWYMSYENDAFIGKIKSIGTSQIQYYDGYEDASARGKVKNVGGYAFSWYDAFNNEAYRGKLRSVGNSQFSYYSSTDDKAFKGKLKSVDNNTITYYSSFDRPEYRGNMKSGTQLFMSNGIKYFLRN